MSEKSMLESKEIYKQLGGNKFSLMTGAKNFGYSETKEGNTNLTFQIGRNKNSITHVSITLNGLDLYDIEFLKIRMISREARLERKVKASFQNVYCENLVETFENATELYARL